MRRLPTIRAEHTRVVNQVPLRRAHAQKVHNYFPRTCLLVTCARAGGVELGAPDGRRADSARRAASCSAAHQHVNTTQLENPSLARALQPEACEPRRRRHATSPDPRERSAPVARTAESKKCQHLLPTSMTCHSLSTPLDKHKLRPRTSAAAVAASCASCTQQLSHTPYKTASKCQTRAAAEHRLSQGRFALLHCRITVVQIRESHTNPCLRTRNVGPPIPLPTHIQDT